MQYPLEESHRILGDTVARATREVIAPAAQELDRTDRPIPAILETLHRIGVATMCHPARVGGPGPDPVACCVATEEIAKASPAVAVMCVANWAAVNVMAARPSEVADAFLVTGHGEADARGLLPHRAQGRLGRGPSGDPGRPVGREAIASTGPSAS